MRDGLSGRHIGEPVAGASAEGSARGSEEDAAQAIACAGIGQALEDRVVFAVDGDDAGAGGARRCGEQFAGQDQLDKAYDVKPYSRLGCQAELDGEEVVYQITEESEKTWYDEHPKERHEAEAAGKWPPK